MASSAAPIQRLAECCCGSRVISYVRLLIFHDRFIDFICERYQPMSQMIRVFFAASLMVCLPLAHAARGDDKEKSATKAGPDRAKLKSPRQKPEHPFRRSTCWTRHATAKVTVTAEGQRRWPDDALVDK